MFNPLKRACSERFGVNPVTFKGDGIVKNLCGIAVQELEEYLAVRRTGAEGC